MTFQDDINRMLAEGYERMQREFSLTLDETVPTPTVTVKRMGYTLPLSLEQAVDAGIMTEEQAREAGWTPYVLPPLLWRHRVRRRWWEWRERTGRKVGGWIAGVDLTERDEDW